MRSDRQTLHRHHHHKGWLIGQTGVLAQRIPAGPQAGQSKLRGDNNHTHQWLQQRDLTDARFDTRRDALRAIAAVMEQDPLNQLEVRAPRLRDDGTWTTADGRWLVHENSRQYRAYRRRADGTLNPMQRRVFPASTSRLAVARELALTGQQAL